MAQVCAFKKNARQENLHLPDLDKAVFHQEAYLCRTFQSKGCGQASEVLIPRSVDSLHRFEPFLLQVYAVQTTGIRQFMLHPAACLATQLPVHEEQPLSPSKAPDTTAITPNDVSSPPASQVLPLSSPDPNLSPSRGHFGGNT